MKCIQCGKESEYGMKVISCDGDFICDNGTCQPNWDTQCSQINTMSDSEFKSYMTSGSN